MKNIIRLILMQFFIFIFINSAYAINTNDFQIYTSDKDKIAFITDSVIYFRENGLYGIKDLKGHILHEATYEDISPFSEHTIPVKENGKWKYILLSGETIITLDNEYQMVEDFQNDYAKVYNTEKKVGLIDKNGNEIISPQYVEIINIGHDNVLIEGWENNTDFLYNPITKEIIKSDFYINSVVKENMHIICDDEKMETTGIIDFDGNIIIPFDKIHYYGYNDGYYIFSNNSFDNWIIYDMLGNVVFEKKCYHIDLVSEDYFLVIDETGAYYLSLSGSKIYPQHGYGDKIQINYMRPFSNDCAIVGIGTDDYTKAIAIDKNGKMIGYNMYDYISDFHNGVAIARWFDGTNDRWTIVDKYLDIIDDSIISKDEYVVSYHDDGFKKGYINVKSRLDENYEKIIRIKLEDLSTSIAKKYIYFDSNGANGIMESKLIECSKTFSIPYSIYTKSGYTFSHWTDGAKKYNPGDEFIMPDHDVTLTAVWKKKSSSSSTSSTDAPVIIPTPEKPPVKASPFKDISNHWGRDYIEVITTKGLVDGITATEFKPDDPMTREMFVIALAKLSGVHSDYTNWAIDIGLLKGYGNGNYGLKDTITREQMAVFFERYMTLAKIDMESLKTVENTTFADDSSIADWSKSSVYTMQAMKLIQGKNNNIFDPQGLTTRAEAATVLYNLITVTGK